MAEIDDSGSFESNYPLLDPTSPAVVDVPIDYSDGNINRALPHDDSAYAGGSDADVAQMIADAKASGVSSPVLDVIHAATKAGGNVLDAVTNWARAHPELAKMFGTGLSTAQTQAYTRENLALSNQYKIDAVNAANARADELWKRRNDSIVGTHAADLGIIGRAMIDPTIYARK